MSSVLQEPWPDPEGATQRTSRETEWGRGRAKPLAGLDRSVASPVCPCTAASTARSSPAHSPHWQTLSPQPHGVSVLLGPPAADLRQGEQFIWKVTPDGTSREAGLTQGTAGRQPGTVESQPARDLGRWWGHTWGPLGEQGCRRADPPLQALAEDTPGAAAQTPCRVARCGCGGGPRRGVWGLLAQSRHPGPSARGACEAAAGQTRAVSAGHTRSAMKHRRHSRLLRAGQRAHGGCAPRVPAGARISS